MDKPLEIDLHAILRGRLPQKINRFVPGFLITALEKLIRQKELNEMLRVAYPSRGSEFSRKILEHLQITVEVAGMENLGSAAGLCLPTKIEWAGFTG